ANRKVVIARPAEPAQVRAAANHFHQKARTEFRVGSEDLRARRFDRGGRGQRRFPDCWRRTGSFARHESIDGPVRTVRDIVEAWNIKPALRSQQGQQIAPAATLPKRVDELWNKILALAGRDDVGKWGKRLRVHERDRAPAHDERISLG